MTAGQPPRLALALLVWSVPDNEPLTGDLIEASRDRSAGWFWRQVLFVILARATVGIRTEPRPTIQALLVALALLAILGFHAVVAANLLGHLLVLNDVTWLEVTGRYQHWQLPSTLLSFTAALLIGRIVGGFHREHRIAAVLAFSTSATAGAFFNLYFFVPRMLLQPLLPRAELQTMVAMVFVAGLLAGSASRRNVAKTFRKTERNVAKTFRKTGRNVARTFRETTSIMRTAAFLISCALGAAGLGASLSAMRPETPASVAAAADPSALLQAPAERQETFEVASIRRNVSNNQVGSGLAAPQPGGRFIALGATLRRLVADAYGDTGAFDVIGGPAWAGTDRFDVNARAEGERSPADIRRMLRSLLADRFKLVVHTERREMPVYTLTLARTDRRLGTKLRRSDPKCAEEARNYFAGATGFPPPCGDFRLGARALSARGMSMDALARLLGGRAGRPGLDATGLDGVYDLELEWSSDLGLQQAPRGAAGAAELSADGLSLFTALQEQLGLKLEPTRGSVGVLVIDSAEPPTLN